MEDLYEALTKVHREVLLPEFERIVRAAFRDHWDGLGCQFRRQIGIVHQRLDRLEEGAEVLHARVRRLEGQLERIEQQLDRREVDRLSGTAAAPTHRSGQGS